MYGGLSQLHGYVHGNHDAVHEDGQNGHEDDVYLHGLHGDVSDVRELHHAHVSNVRQDVRDVLRCLQDVRHHVRRHERQSYDDALRGDVPPLRRVLHDDCEDHDGRISPWFGGAQGSGAAHSAPGPFAELLRRGPSAKLES